MTHIDPTIAVCSANYDNMFDHPRDEIRELLHEQGIQLKTTKTGDVIIKSVGNRKHWAFLANRGLSFV